eukprot:TRINITY_DN3490_c0_g1_i3.p1 TRINITY_DN3490_c0_g1~~TRINITY_DN3490_c0_g1_i3.p1  ORF type:complete len:933 (+),score=299.40 TRINITY_DN3490_c0_g1_i3:40-2799(+)
MAATSPPPAAVAGNTREELEKMAKYVVILKKAVVQEQQKNEELTKALKEKEVNLRQAVEKDDILTFNNQRLSKRVQVMQDELQQAQTKKGKSEGGGWFGGGSSSAAKADQLQRLNATEDELRNKIKENELLHEKLYDVSAEHKKIVDMLEQRLSSIKSTNIIKEEEFAQKAKFQQNAVQQAVADKDKMAEMAQSLENQLAQAKQNATQREAMLQQTIQRVTTELSREQKMLKQKVVFNDTQNEMFNKWNLHPYSIKQQKEIACARDGIYQVVQQLITSYETHNSALREKLLITNRSSFVSLEQKSANSKAAEMLPQYCSHLVAIFDVLSNGKPLKEIAERWRTFVVFNAQLLAHHTTRLDEEARTYEASGAQQQALRQRLSLLGGAYAELQSSVVAMGELLHATLQQHTTDDEQDQQSLGSVDTKQFLHNFYAIYNAHKSLCMHMVNLYGAPSSSGSTTSTNADTSPRTTTPHLFAFLADGSSSDALGAASIDERLTASVSGLVGVFARLATALEQLLSLVSTPDNPLVRGAVVSSFSGGVLDHSALRQRSRGYMHRVNTALALQPQGVPFETVLYNSARLPQLQASLQELTTASTAQSREIAALKNANAELQRKLTSVQEAYAEKHIHLKHLETELKKVQTSQQSSSLMQDFLPPSVEPATSPPTQSTTAALLQHTTPPATSPSTPNLIDDSLQLLSPLKLFTTTTVEPKSTSLMLNLIDLDASVPAQSHTSPLATQQSLLDLPLTETPPLLTHLKTPSANLLEASPPHAPTPLTTNNRDDNSNANSTTPATQPNYTLTVIDEYGVQSTNLGLPPEAREREQQLKTYYESHTAHLSKQLQAVDSKSVKLHESLRRTMEQLETVQQRKEELVSRVDELGHELEASKEDTVSTRTSFEQQIQVRPVICVLLGCVVCFLYF